jgi:phage tail sheath gpL-like
MKSTVTIEVAEGVDPFGHNTTRPKRAIFRELIRLLMKFVNGGATTRTTTRPVAIAGLVQASAIVTCATVVNANTVTLSGQALTATQHNARATATCAAVAVADTVTIAGQALTAIKQRASATVTCSTAIVGNTVVVDGVTFTGASGAVTLGEATFSIDTGDTQTATSLAAQINAHVVTAAKLTATSSSAVVTLRAVNAGTAGNALTLTSSGSTVAVSAATLTGGIAVANNQFDVSPGATDTQVAADLVRCINASTTAAISGVVTATNAAGVVTVRAVTAGTAGNSITFISSNGSRLAVTGSGALAGGAAVANNQFDFSVDNTATARALAAAINASTTAILDDVVEATSSAAEVTIKCRHKGKVGNSITIATSGSTLAITGSVSRLAGGTQTAYTF